MQVKVQVVPEASVELVDAADCSRLEVLVDKDATDEAVEQVLTANGVGALHGDDVRLDGAWLCREALSGRPPADPNEFGTMMTYASSQGWVDMAAGWIQAHVVRV